LPNLPEEKFRKFDQDVPFWPDSKFEFLTFQNKVVPNRALFQKLFPNIFLHVASVRFLSGAATQIRSIGFRSVLPGVIRVILLCFHTVPFRLF
jgi:hypothetical protein